jgi:hypothetical protein
MWVEVLQRGAVPILNVIAADSLISLKPAAASTVVFFELVVLILSPLLSETVFRIDKSRAARTIPEK